MTTMTHPSTPVAPQHQITFRADLMLRPLTTTAPAEPAEPAPPTPTPRKRRWERPQLPAGECDVLRRVQNYEAGAFEELYAKYEQAIYSYLYRMFDNADDAADLTQETFLKAYLHAGRTTPDTRLGAWLYRIATNVGIDLLRHRKVIRFQPLDSFVSAIGNAFAASRTQSSNNGPSYQEERVMAHATTQRVVEVLTDPQSQPEQQVMAAELTERVQAVLMRMQPRYRMCLILREYHDLSYDEIAEVLSTTRASVKSLLFRAREEFRQITKRHPLWRDEHGQPATN